MGKRFGSGFKAIKEAIEQLSAEQLEAFEGSGQLTLDGETFHTDDLLLFRESLNADEVLTNRMITIQMDTTLTPELIQEGLAREIVSRIQKSRKDSGLHVADRIHIRYEASEPLTQAITVHHDNITKETLALSLSTDPSKSKSNACR